MAVDEVELGECQDAVAVERRLEGEVEAGECLDGREPRHHQRGLDAPVLADRELGAPSAIPVPLGPARGRARIYKDGHGAALSGCADVAGIDVAKNRLDMHLRPGLPWSVIAQDGVEVTRSLRMQAMIATLACSGWATGYGMAGFGAHGVTEGDNP